MDDETLELIQTRIAFLERANSELSDVVFRQQREIQALTLKIKELMQRLEATQSGNDEHGTEEQRPPHY
jgi:SlyX protein